MRSEPRKIVSSDRQSMLIAVILGLAVIFISPMLGAFSMGSGNGDIETSADTDSDGLPDVYENSYEFLNPLNSSDAALDQDGDGYTNLEEYIVDTAPDDAASKPGAGEVLLIDGEMPIFSALSDYTDVLDQLGVTYDVLTVDTENVSAKLAVYQSHPDIYNKIIWFGEWGTGPDQTAETALAATLDAGKCVLISSQDYYAHSNYSEEITAFMGNYLGVASMVGEVSTSTVSGAGRFSGLGSYSLAYFGMDLSDSVTPDDTAFTGFIGTNGGAAIFKDNGVYRTGFLTFPLEAIDDVNDRSTVIEALLDYCGTGHHDFDGDGTPDVNDPDDDNDGLPDAYEESHAFLDPLNASDASLDEDDDGLTNKYEFDNQLDPTDGICPTWVCGGGKGWRHAISLIK